MKEQDRRVIIVGAGGHAKVVIDVLRMAGWRPEGLLDCNPIKRSVLGVEVVGDDHLSRSLFEAGYRNAFVAIGRNDLRRRLGTQLRDMGFTIVTAAHPTATISPSAIIGSGVVIMPHAIINADARIRDFAIINTGAIVEHDCVVGEAAHIAPRSVIGGQVMIEDEVFFGIGAVARPHSVIGARSTVGAGAVVVGNVQPLQIVAGIPARPLRSSSRKRLDNGQV